MAIAGKVAITLSTENGGAWSADVTYDRLVAVKHNNNLYISRKTVANIEPPNDEFWFLALEGFGGDDVQALIDRLNELSDLIQAIINGTTQVGNAKTLDGHGAEYFLPKKNGVIPKGTSLYFEKDDNSTLIGNVKVEVSGDYIRFSENGGKSRGAVIKLSECLDWLGSVLLHTGNMADHVLPLSGGTLTDVLRFAKVSNGNGYLQKNHTADTDNGFYVVDTSKEGKLARIEVSAKNQKAYFTGDDRILKELLHTGNKPTGTYNGNGSATSRTVSVGGIGKMLVIKNSLKGMFFVDAYGGFGIRKNGETASLTKEECKFENGILTTATTDEIVNAVNFEYDYISV